MNLNKIDLKKGLERYLLLDYGKKISDAEQREIYLALAKTVMEAISEDWFASTKKYETGKQLHYFSSEFLMGRYLGNNLINLQVLENIKSVFEELKIDYNIVEDIEEDAGIGNGGLGRLAACFIDSLATLNLPGRGYSIRYKNGIFNQKIENGHQVEYPETWLKYGDPWSVKKITEAVMVEFKDFTVKAMPYDTPVIAYDTRNVNTLRLWEAQALEDLDYQAFNAQDYDKALWKANRAEDISRILYPNDSTNEGKLLRLRQQYFFVSASLQDILRKFKQQHGKDFQKLPDFAVIQLNDTHPVIAIPELMRLLCDIEGLEWNEAWQIATKTFAYTNHTILAEALEKWWIGLYEAILPRIYEIILQINNQLQAVLEQKYPHDVAKQYRMLIVQGGLIHMAWLAIYGSSYTNGVAQIHTDILKTAELKDWYELYPERFQNKTNGITQRRWLLLSNPELADLITRLIGKAWVKDLSELKKLEKYSDDEKILKEFLSIKEQKKSQLADYLQDTQNIILNKEAIFDIQVKRLHEYKRQLLNIFYVIDLYNKLKENSSLEMYPVIHIFGSKAAPGYKRAKGIIKLINEVAKKINSDPEVNTKLQIVFIENYRVSSAHKVFPAADISEQISTAGKEASGTGNMKFMLNGALTLGTLDGANVEIAQEAGAENNFIFGLTVEDIHTLKAQGYDSTESYHQVEGLKKVVDSLIDGTFSDDGSGVFKDLHNSLFISADWHAADEYFVLKDFDAYRIAQKQANLTYQDRKVWAKKAWLNIANAGKFSSDRTIAEYARDIWKIEAKKI